MNIYHDIKKLFDTRNGYYLNNNHQRDLQTESNIQREAIRVYNLLKNELNNIVDIKNVKETHYACYKLLEIVLIENMKRPLRTEDELWAWFRYMRNFDLTRLEERRQLIDVFVNTVFLYNDRFLLTLNFGYGSKTVLFTDIPCSDKVACGRPYRVFIYETFH